MLTSRTRFGLLALLLAACSNAGSTEITEPKADNRIVEFGIATPDGDGTIDADFAPSGQHVAGTAPGATSGGFTYRMGLTNAGDFTAIAGILPNTTFTAPPATGQITYDATYQAKSLENIKEIDGELHALGGVGVHGSIALTADFDDGTFAGAAATNTRSAISLTGTVDGARINGTVTFRGMEGALAGVAGSDQVIGAFAGSGDPGVFAGGFTGQPAE